MAIRTLQVLIEREPANDIILARSPSVGLYRLHPEPGSFLMRGARAGQLVILNQICDLILPADVQGQVDTLSVTDKIVPVEYGQVLFHLHQWDFQSGIETLGTNVEVRTVTGQAMAEGTYPVASPTDGVFYLKPNPTVEAYVHVGSRVAEGQVLGLVEVMKCFNPIQYGGPGMPPEAEVVEICAQDGAEIKSGQVLFRVR